MIYRIRIDLAFTDEDPLNDILEHAVRSLPDAHTLNPGTDLEEKGYIVTEYCYHDENPQEVCEKLEEYYTTP